MRQDEIDALRSRPVEPGRLFIGGKWEPAANGASLDVISPIDGNRLTTIADAGAGDVDRAVKSARAAFDRGAWSRAAPAERRKVLLRLADLIERHALELAVLGVREVIVGRKAAAVPAILDELPAYCARIAMSWCAIAALVAHSIVKLKPGFVPGMGDVEGSGGMMKPIDNLLIVHRNSAKADAIEKADDNGDTSKKNAALLHHDAMLIIAKNREDGRWHRLKLWFDPVTRLLRTKQAELPQPILAVPQPTAEEDKQLF